MFKISVIIPVYNSDNYLSKCIESLLAQTLKDIEFIFIDDFSTDNSLNIIKQYAQQDNRIKFLENHENMGQGLSRNLGIAIAQGEYIGFVDSDDWTDCEMFEKMYNQATTLDSDIVICDRKRFWGQKRRRKNIYKTANDWKMIGNYKTISRKRFYKIKEGVNFTVEDIKETVLVTWSFAWNKIYKKSLIINSNAKFANGRISEDVPFVLEVLLSAKAISYINKPLYFYREDSSNSITSQKSTDFFNDFVIHDNIKYILKKYNRENEFEKNLNFHILFNAYKKYKNIPMDKKELYLEKCREYLSEKDYNGLLIMLGLRANWSFKGLLQKIFSIKNDYSNHKIITILGLRITINYVT